MHYEQLFPGRTAEDGVLVLILIYAAGAVSTAVVGGLVSDRSGRRKPLVIVSSVVMAAGALLLAAWPTWTAAMVAAGLLGTGYGVYMAVDTALITQVLPAAVDRGKDLGVINIANAAPQVLAPALAAPIVATLGGYPVLYGLTARSPCSARCWCCRSARCAKKARPARSPWADPARRSAPWSGPRPGPHRAGPGQPSVSSTGTAITSTIAPLRRR